MLPCAWLVVAELGNAPTRIKAKSVHRRRTQPAGPCLGRRTSKLRTGKVGPQAALQPRAMTPLPAGHQPGCRLFRLFHDSRGRRHQPSVELRLGRASGPAVEDLQRIGAGLDVINGEDAVLCLTYEGQIGDTTRIHSIGLKGSAKF